MILQILLVVCRLYIICMDIQRVSNSLFLLWMIKGSIEYTWHLSKVLFLWRLHELVWSTNVSLKISGDKPRWILNISVAKTCKFPWCIETKLSLLSSSWNVDVSSWYVILRALPCIEFRRVLLDIQTNGK